MIWASMFFLSLQLMPPGVRFCDLSSLIDYIYNGEVRIASQDLTSFMALAEQFKIKGLTEDKVKVPGKHKTLGEEYIFGGWGD